jgi:hypothetical protein
MRVRIARDELRRIRELTDHQGARDRDRPARRPHRPAATARTGLRAADRGCNSPNNFPSDTRGSAASLTSPIVFLAQPRYLRRTTAVCSVRSAGLSPSSSASPNVNSASVQYSSSPKPYPASAFFSATRCCAAASRRFSSSVPMGCSSPTTFNLPASTSRWTACAPAWNNNDRASCAVARFPARCWDCASSAANDGPPGPRAAADGAAGPEPLRSAWCEWGVASSRARSGITQR